ncbi:MAG TPA: hypothetical protein VGO53_15160 [Steroidobacteraceae bacterium]|nr:hypothetical protein [Steroidobacteraceae bacterium]
MSKRAIQLVLVGLAGAFLAWLLVREDDAEPAPTHVAEVRPAQSAPVTAAPVTPPSAADAITFRLPKVGSPAREAAPEAEASPPPTFKVPKDWQLRGSGSRNYELRSDGDTVFTGNHSAMLASHSKEVQPNLSGSGVQAVFAGPYAGTRVELNAVLRSEGLRGGGGIWMYVTDPGRVVVAYQIAQMAPKSDTGEWTRYRVVMDVPWHAELIAYGFTLQGRGKLWVDDMHLTPVDVNVPLTGPQNNHQLGVIAQAVSVDGALANPTNMDFEDFQTTRERQPDAPPDQINGTRF